MVHLCYLSWLLIYGSKIDPEETGSYPNVRMVIHFLTLVLTNDYLIDANHILKLWCQFLARCSKKH